MTLPDIIFDSPEIRKQCIKRIEENNVDVKLLAKALGAEPWRINRFLSKHPKGYMYQAQIIQLAGFLGIELKIQLVLNPVSVINEDIKFLPDDTTKIVKERYRGNPKPGGLDLHFGGHD